MTDIVERLLDPSSVHSWTEADTQREEAAHEINDLRTEVATIRAASASVQADQRAAIDSAREMLRIMTAERDALRDDYDAACALLAQSNAERDALRADADRMRWLFPDGCDSVLARANRVYREWDGQSDWRAAIDAAMAAQTKDSEPAAPA